MRNLKLFLLTSAFILATGLAANAQEWTKFAPEGGRFEVMLPGPPEASTETKDSANGPYTTKMYIVRTDDMIFMVAYVDYDPKFNFDVKAEIQANKTNFLKPFAEGKLLSEKEITFNGSPGLEFAADLNAARTVVSRIFVIGKRPYQMIAVNPKGADQTVVWKFHDSFKTTKG